MIVFVLTDCFTNCAVSENEAVFVVYFDPTPPWTDMVKGFCSYVKLVFMKAVNAKVVMY